MTIAQLITLLEINIKSKNDDIVKRTKDVESIKNAISIIQETCKHVHDDGSSAYEEYAHDSHHKFECCTICKKEVTI